MFVMRLHVVSAETSSNPMAGICCLTDCRAMSMAGVNPAAMPKWLIARGGFATCAQGRGNPGEEHA